MSNGRARGLTIPGISARDAHIVNRAGMEEGIWQPLYDFQTYPNAGTTKMTFFQLPIGQSSKTEADTNMESAGQLPQPKFFLATSIMLVLFPGFNPSIEQAAPPADSHWNDQYAFHKSGYLDLFIGSKSYLKSGPLGRFPPDFRLAGAAALSDASTAAVNLFSRTEYATMAGPVFSIVPVLLEPNQNFNVTLNWPTAVAMPSGIDSRVGVMLNGYLYRLSQ